MAKCTLVLGHSRLERTGPRWELGIRESLEEKGIQRVKCVCIYVCECAKVYVYAYFNILSHRLSKGTAADHAHGGELESPGRAH